MGNALSVGSPKSCNKCNQSALNKEVIYCPKCRGSLSVFLAGNPISDLFKNEIDSFIVTNKSLDINAFRKKLPILPVSSITFYISQHRQRVNNYKLLDLVMVGNNFCGCWVIMWNNDDILDSCWKLIATVFYASELNFQHLCCKRKKEGEGGFILVANDDFRNVPVIKQMAERLSPLISQMSTAIPSEINYIPAIFFGMGKLCVKETRMGYWINYIYNYTLGTRELIYGPDVEQWLAMHEGPNSLIGGSSTK
ncbi:hypothetical protein CHUAL_008050 [Chamberlinius hualienensis]